MSPQEPTVKFLELLASRSLNAAITKILIL